MKIAQALLASQTARVPSPTPKVSRPEVVKQPEATTMALCCHTREGRSSDILTEVNIQPQIVVQVEIHVQNIPGEMVGRPTARPETEIEMPSEVVSTQTTPPSLAAPAGGSAYPSAFMCEMENVSGYPLPARLEAVTAALSDVRTTSSFIAHSNPSTK